MTLRRAARTMARMARITATRRDAKWYGVGHNAVCTFDGADYIIFHGYDASDERARSKLRIEKLQWDDAGWPVVKLAAP